MFAVIRQIYNHRRVFHRPSSNISVGKDHLWNEMRYFQGMIRFNHSLGMTVRSEAKQGKKLVFGSDNSRVLDRGVWKRFKYCSHCNLIIVERAKWAKNFDEIKYCSDRCRNASKRKDAKGNNESQP